MELEERTLDDNFQDVCEVCGTSLTELEIHAAREAGPPFLCSKHAAEELPTEPAVEVGGEADGPPSAA